MSARVTILCEGCGAAITGGAALDAMPKPGVIGVTERDLVDIIEQAAFETGTGLETALLATERILALLTPATPAPTVSAEQADEAAGRCVVNGHKVNTRAGCIVNTETNVATFFYRDFLRAAAILTPATPAPTVSREQVERMARENALISSEYFDGLGDTWGDDPDADAQCVADMRRCLNAANIPTEAAE